MKKIIVSLLLIFIGSSILSPVFAEDMNMAKTMEKKFEGRGRSATESGNSGPSTQSLEVLKKRANMMIDKRIESLKKLWTRVDANPKLDADSKAEVKKQIDEVVARLTALKTDVANATDTASVQALFKKVLDEKVYTNVMQKVQLLHLINKLSMLTTKLETLSTGLETLILNAEKEGKDVTTLKTNLASLKTQIATLKTTLAGAKTRISTASATDYKQTIIDVRGDILKVRLGLMQVKILIASIRIDLKKLNGASDDESITPTSTSSPSLTPTSPVGE